LAPSSWNAAGAGQVRVRPHIFSIYPLQNSYLVSALASVFLTGGRSRWDFERAPC
jgi:hypothetical protein